jgi:phosphonate utilization transcriptional regulator
VPKAVQKEIEKMILSGTFEAGQKLGEVDIATRLGVSRGPVREAFRGLEEAGLIRVSKNRGVFVREISIHEAVELYEVRAGLDACAAQMLAPCIEEAQLRELDSLVDRMDALLLRNEMSEYFLSNIKFHDRIIEMTGNSKLLEIYRRLINETHLMRHRSISEGQGRLASSQEHRQIVRALATRDPDVAVRALRNHVTSGRERFIAALNAQDGALKTAA